jgi:hypothetical protein
LLLDDGNSCERERWYCIARGTRVPRHGDKNEPFRSYAYGQSDPGLPSVIAGQDKGALICCLGDVFLAVVSVAKESLCVLDAYYNRYRNAYFPDRHIKFPPILPIPGYPTKVTSPYPFIWPPHPLPVYMTQTFTTLCEFWIIVQEIDSVYLLKGSTPLSDRVSLAFAESKYRKLLAWASELPQQMIRDESSTHDILFFQYAYEVS